MAHLIINALDYQEWNYYKWQLRMLEGAWSFEACGYRARQAVGFSVGH